MKQIRSILSTLAGVALCLVVSSASAQQAQPQQPAAQRAAQPKLLVGVVDVREALSVHPVVSEELEAINKKYQLEEIEFGKAQQEAQEKVNKLNQEFKVGTPEYDSQINAIRKSLADSEFKLREAQEQLTKQRTQRLFHAYKDLQKAVQQVAQANGVIIVHSKVKIKVPEDANVPEDQIALQEADSNTIVWNHPACDITEQVKAAVTAIAGASAPAGGSPLANLGGQAMQTAAATPAPQAAPRAAANPAAAQRR